jgi:hypothetical protein
LKKYLAFCYTSLLSSNPELLSIFPNEGLSIVDKSPFINLVQVEKWTFSKGNGELLTGNREEFRIWK